MRKTSVILAQLLWLAFCAVALIYAQKDYQGVSDWKVEEGLAFEMMIEEIRL
jgi:hypothetical protein